MTWKISLLFFTIAIFLFETINWYGTKNTEGLLNVIKYSIITLPIQLIAYILLVYGLNQTFRLFEKDVWMLLLTTTTITWIVKIFTAYMFFGKMPSLGKVIGLILVIIANIIGKIVR